MAVSSNQNYFGSDLKLLLTLDMEAVFKPELCFTNGNMRYFGFSIRAVK